MHVQTAMAREIVRIVLCAAVVLSALSVVAAVHFKMEWYVKKITIHR